MTIVILYVAMGIVFLALDSLMLANVIRPLFHRHLGERLLARPRLVPAALFYFGYLAGLLWLVALPALRAGSPTQALVEGAVLGAVAYGTYELTNHAVMRDWRPSMVVVDMLWGTVLTAVTAWAGVTAALALAR